VSGQEFFLFTSDRSFKRGDRVVVEGPFGPATAAAFREDKGEYMRWYSVFILVVWKIRKEDPGYAPCP
jgi:hypothetical protein